MRSRPSPRLRFLLGGATLLAAACTGAIANDDRAPAASTDPERPGVMPGRARPSTPAPADRSGTATVRQAGPMPLRRLTRREYDNTVRDLLGDTSHPAQQFPAERSIDFPFPQPGPVATQDASLIRYAAETLAANLRPKVRALVPCDPAVAGEEPCARQFVTTFGLRAFRRPPAPPETDRLIALYRTARALPQATFDDGIDVLVEAMLQSPAFLYHWEAGPGAAARDGDLITIDPYQMASRLSYFVWGTMPDDALFAAAAGKRLASAADVEEQARRMLADPRARDTTTAFFDAWLSLDDLPDAVKDPHTYPTYDAPLRASMQDEAHAFVADVLTAGDGRWDTLITSPRSFVDPRLAGLYGVTGVTGAGLRVADLDPGQRGGLLTRAAFLTVTGSTDGSNPVHRGLAIFQSLLCKTLPPPPPDVPPPAPPSAGGTTRERLASHEQMPCARACHTLIDPLGYAFEHYDGIGRWRTVDNGRPVDASGALTLDGVSRPFPDAVGLSRELAASADVRRCFATQWLRFALGRPEVDADGPSIDQATDGFVQAQDRVSDAIVAVATSPSFRYRSITPGEILP